MKIYISLLISYFFLMVSCVKMEEVHQKYIPDGETIYRVKPRNVIAYSGNNRAKLTWQLFYPTLVTKCEVRDKDSVLVEIPVEYKDSLNLECILSDLSEKTYTFSLYSLDTEGNSSIKNDVVVEVFGEKYLNTLKTTTSLKSVWRRTDNKKVALISLSESISSKIAGTTIFYKSISGKEDSILVKNGIPRIEIQGVATDSYFKLQDLYQPTTNCIDLFPAPAQNYSVSDLSQEGSRTFSSVYKIDDKTVYAKLTPSKSETVRTIIKYGDKTVVLNADINEVTLENVMPTDEITVETILQIEGGQVEYSAAIQTFNAKSLLSKVDMQNWEVVDYSSHQENEGPIVNAIDNQISTYWHTEYSPNQPGYPHFITVDMKENITVKAIAVARRNGNNNIASCFILELSSDGTNWKPIDEFSIDNSTDGIQIIPLKTAASGRFFKLTGKTSATSNAFMCVSEINLFK